MVVVFAQIVQLKRLVRSFLVGVGKLLTAMPDGEFPIVNKEPNQGEHFGAFWRFLYH